ncbi:MAG: urease accessory protein [Caulobacter sp.]|nr:urease accessory protein [Caulobacter sp.]
MTLKSAHSPAGGNPSTLSAFAKAAWIPALAGTSGLLLLATPALAHPGHEQAATFAAGLSHPFSGLDHMLAMLSVGLWAAMRGGKAVWAWPLAFVTAMIGGGALGLAGLQLPLVEPAILASVIVLGALTATAVRAPVLAGAALIALFGLAHGFAHGAEAPLGSPALYAIGFVIATAGLHLAGLGAGLGLIRLRHPLVLRLLGAGAALGGLAMVFA